MKKNNYNIKRNPPKLSSKDIEQHKDFDALLNQFETSPASNSSTSNTSSGSNIIRPLYIISGAVAAALIGLVVFFNISSPVEPSYDYEKENHAYFASQPYVNPPLNQSVEDIERTFVKHSLNADLGGVYEHGNGSKLYIPPSAFVHQDGRQVSGEVELSYREFHDFVDIFMAGIPMEYDSAGVKYNLESAGMIEVHAQQNGQRLNLAPDKTINVELASSVKYPKHLNVPPGYNIYKLDEENRDWVYQDVDDMELIGDPFWEEVPTEDAVEQKFKTAKDNLAQKEAKALRNIERENPLPQAPKKPNRATSDNYVFDFDFDLADFPELKIYQDVMWQVINEAEFTAQVAETTWEDAKIAKRSDNQFELTLIGGNTSKTLGVRPVLTGKAYNSAMADFNKAHEEYTAIRKEQEQRIEASKAALREQIRAEREMLNFSYEEKIEHLRKNGGSARQLTGAIAEQNIINRFEISSLGIWNVDRPLPPFVMMVKANFTDEEGIPFAYNTAYMVDKSLNTVYKFMTNKNINLRFNQNSDNLMWLVTNEGKIAICKPAEFKKLTTTQKQHTFAFKVLDKKINSKEDIRAVLNFES